MAGLAVLGGGGPRLRGCSAGTVWIGADPAPDDGFGGAANGVAETTAAFAAQVKIHGLCCQEAVLVVRAAGASVIARSGAVAAVGGEGGNAWTAFEPLVVHPSVADGYPNAASVPLSVHIYHRGADSEVAWDSLGTFSAADVAAGVVYRGLGSGDGRVNVFYEVSAGPPLLPEDHTPAIQEDVTGA